MFLVEKTWHPMSISPSALMGIRSEKEIVEGGGMLTEAQQTCPILIHGPWSTDSRETP